MAIDEIDKTGRPPGPVVAAVAVWAFMAAIAVVVSIGLVASGEALGALYVISAILPAAIAYGLWQGNRGARVVAIIFGLGSCVGGLGMILLLAMPRSSRTWFTPAVTGFPDAIPDDFSDEDEGTD